MKFTKILSMLLCVIMVLACFASCGAAADDKKDEETTKTDDTTVEAATDLQYVVDKGTLVVGITDFAPMDYQDEDGNWIGFDADLATKFADYLGVDVEFSEIVWENKILELNGKTIDCVWNGMTLNDEVKASMATSAPYCNNAQVVIVKADVADQYQSVDACKELNFAVEDGSAGKEMAEENEFEFTPVESQAAALMEVAAGTCDAAIIDALMAAAMVGEGTGYADLTYTISLNSEEYGVGFRQGSDLCDKFAEFFAEITADGTIDEVAELYGVQAALIK